MFHADSVLPALHELCMLLPRRLGFCHARKIMKGEGRGKMLWGRCSVRGKKERDETSQRARAIVRSKGSVAARDFVGETMVAEFVGRLDDWLAPAGSHLSSSVPVVAELIVLK